MFRHTQMSCRQQPVNCLSVFDQVVGLPPKELMVFEILFNASQCFTGDLSFFSFKTLKVIIVSFNKVLKVYSGI